MSITPINSNQNSEYRYQQIQDRKEISDLQMKPDVSKGVEAIRDKHYNLPRRLAFAFLVIATGGLAYLFKKAVSVAALNSKWGQLTPHGRSERQAYLSQVKNAFLKSGTFANNLNLFRTASYGIPTVDGEAKLDAAIVFSDNASKRNFNEEGGSSTKDDYWIVYLNGNNGLYENCMGELDETREAVEKKLQEQNSSAKVHIAMFNYRGIGYSEGNADCADHLVLDGITICQFLLNQGIPANRISLDGMSMGGMSSTKAYSFFNQQGEKINLIRERTFSKLSKAANIVAESFVGSSKLGTFVEWIFRATNWHGDAEKALNKANDSKDWGAVLELYHPEDPMMKEGALRSIVAEHKKNQGLDNTSIISLPSRVEIARDAFMQQEWASDLEKANEIKDELKTILNEHTDIALLRSAKESINKSQTKEDLVNNLNHYLRILGQIMEELTQPNAEKLQELVAYGTTKKYLTPKGLGLLQNQVDLVYECLEIAQHGNAHNLHVTHTKKWKEDIIPAIAALFKETIDAQPSSTSAPYN